MWNDVLHDIRQKIRCRQYPCPTSSIFDSQLSVFVSENIRIRIRIRSYPYSNSNLNKNMKTNMVSEISVRIRSDYIPRWAPCRLGLITCTASNPTLSSNASDCPTHHAPGESNHYLICLPPENLPSPRLAPLPAQPQDPAPPAPRSPHPTLAGDRHRSTHALRPARRHSFRLLTTRAFSLQAGTGGVARRVGGGEEEGRYGGAAGEGQGRLRLPYQASSHWG